MTKETILNALSCCAKGTCVECYYYGLDDCDKKMCKDTVAMLNASETNAKPKYSCAIIFTKKGNLLDYLSTDKMSYGNTGGNPPSDSIKAYYAKERDIELILLCRWEKNKVMCRIKCPVNPIPVKGEFEAPTYGAICRFLTRNGWKFKEKFYPIMFT